MQEDQEQEQEQKKQPEALAPDYLCYHPHQHKEHLHRKECNNNKKSLKKLI